MSPLRKKKNDSDSGSESDSDSSSSSSSQETSKKQSSKKHKYSSDDSERKTKRRFADSFDDSDSENAKQKKANRSEDREVDHKRDSDSKFRSSERNSQKHRDERRSREREEVVRYKKDIRPRDKPERRENEDREKYKVKRDDRGYNRDKYNPRERYDDRSRYDNRDKNRTNDKDRYKGFEGNRRNEGEDRNRRNENRRRRSRSFDHANAKWGKPEHETKSKKENQQKEKPNFGLSGKLTEETNTYKGVVIKYSEPPEARKPRRRWRLYPFKGEKALQTLYIHRESAYLIGRERKIVDLPVDHPSCSKQHAALQYRLVPFTRENGSSGKRVRPYLIDLESANGTYINSKKIDSKKYYELFEKDVIKFGYSSREYVLLHENSKDEALDDDVKMEEEVEVKIKEEN